MLNNNNKIWITWEKQRRSIELANQFGADLVILSCKSKSRCIRYPYLSLKTILLLKNNYSHIFCQNPSIILALLLGLFKFFCNYTLIVDRHSNFIIDNKNWAVVFLYNLISDITIKLAHYTIVTNDNLKNLINEKGGKALVLQDKIPSLDKGKVIDLEGKFNLVFITSFSFDEPIEEVVNAFEKIKDNVFLYITGNYSDNTFVKNYINKKPKNIIFTGFIDEIKYQNLLTSVDAVIVLTKLENLLTCGAYEGVSLCKPLILSNTETIRNYFSTGAIYCDNNVESIKLSIENCLKNLDNMRLSVSSFKNEALINWNKSFKEICYIIFDK